jgi:hypothetical protein
LKGKLLVLLALTLFVLCLPLLVKAQADTVIWRDDMNYQSFDQLQAAGWTSEHATGVSFGSSGVILDQTHGDTAVHYTGHFSSGIYNWKVEDASRWISGDHCGNIISAITEKHNYAFSADGWYSCFAFYHDGGKVYTSDKGTFSESKGVALTLSMTKIDNKIYCYYNGELKYTYTESDSTPSQLVGVDAVSPWRGASEYDYFELSSASTPSAPTSDNILSNPIVIGGAIGGVGIGVGAAVYYFVIAGGSSAAGSASAGSSVAGAASGSGGSGGGGGTEGGSGSNSGENITQPISDGSGPLVSNHPIGELTMNTTPITPIPVNNSPGMQQPPSTQTTSDSIVNQMIQNNQQQQMDSIVNQMMQDNQQQQMERWKIQHDTQTKPFEIQQDVTQNKQKTADKASQNMDQYLRSSNDPDAVADSGGGSGGSEA